MRPGFETIFWQHAGNSQKGSHSIHESFLSAPNSSKGKKGSVGRIWSWRWKEKKKDWKCWYKLFLTAKSSSKASSICFTPNVPRKWSIGDAATTTSITAVASKTRWAWVPDSVTSVIPGWHGKQTPVPVGKSDSTIYLTQQVFVLKKVPVVIRK